MSAHAMWECEATLSCGHKVYGGLHDTVSANDLCPRRKDGTFAALPCPERCGRRRIVAYYTRLVDRLEAIAAAGSPGTTPE